MSRHVRFGIPLRFNIVHHLLVSKLYYRYYKSIYFTVGFWTYNHRSGSTAGYQWYQLDTTRVFWSFEKRGLRILPESWSWHIFHCLHFVMGTNHLLFRNFWILVSIFKFLPFKVIFISLEFWVLSGRKKKQSKDFQITKFLSWRIMKWFWYWEIFRSVDKKAMLET